MCGWQPHLKNVYFINLINKSYSIDLIYSLGLWVWINKLSLLLSWIVLVRVNNWPQSQKLNIIIINIIEPKRVINLFYYQLSNCHSNLWLSNRLMPYSRWLCQSNGCRRRSRLVIFEDSNLKCASMCFWDYNLIFLFEFWRRRRKKLCLARD